VNQRRRRWTEVMTSTRGDGVIGSDDVAARVGSRLCLSELRRPSGQNGVRSSETAATPENDAFWFAHADERCPELNRAFDGFIARGRPLTINDLADAHARLSASAAAAGEPLQREVTSCLDTLRQGLSEMRGDVRDFGASLQMADRKLAGDRRA